ncbi:HvfC/BufC N-terminal domain-containing protein [Algicola sagamiensis]|uniref:HvfC/BufC N-terminal domain-containing protein n=1 Tax=Algicola sagamiensis TaxID=163869 RepID=UPI00037B1E20|nr:DNA-binding domain-containing protein [Algicola sagamiensis]
MSCYARLIEQFAEGVLSEEIAAYTDNYIGAHLSAIETTYPALYEQLGADTFGAIAQMYIRHHVPQSWDINLYGEAFYHWIRGQTEGGKADSFSWGTLARIAQIEYAISIAYYAKESQELPDGLSLIEQSEQDQISPDLLCALTKQHPYTDFQAYYDPKLPIIVWREGIRVQVRSVAHELFQALE